MRNLGIPEFDFYSIHVVRGKRPSFSVQNVPYTAHQCVQLGV